MADAKVTTFEGSLSDHGRTYLIAVVGIAVLFLVSKLTSKPRDAREPVLVHPRIPLIGHILSMVLHQAEYFISLSKKVQQPIFEINVLGGRIYLVNSPELFQNVFRHSKVFSFDPLTAIAIRKVFQMPDRIMELLKAPRPGQENAAFPLHSDTNKSMAASLAPGPSSPILLMNARALGRLSQFLRDIDEDSIVVGFHRWLSDVFTVATSVGVYGPDSPLEKDSSLVNHVENFTDQLGMLMVGVAPSLIAPKGLAARRAYNVAFENYYRNGGNKNASALIKGREHVLIGGGFTHDELASFDISIMLAATANSNPALFWFLSYIYSNPQFLAELREEIRPAISMTGNQATFDVSYLLKECPVLVASWQELLRIRSVTISSRIVTEDTLLNDQYLLRKGGVIQLVSAPSHSSPEIWGVDADGFNPSRFLKSAQENVSKETRKQRRDGFTPFGGGSSLCPGRNFVTMEVLGAVATLVTGYDITKVDGGVLEVPKHKDTSFGAQIRRAEGDPQVKISRREEWAGKVWRYDVGDGVGEGSSGLAFNVGGASGH